MSRTFRNINFKPSVSKYTYYDGEIGITIYLKGVRRSYRSIDDSNIKRDFYELYRDRRRTSYKYYRKFEEQQFRTYCKRFIKNSLENNEDGALKPVTKSCRGYWD